jgi:hypothetical protein
MPNKIVVGDTSYPRAKGTIRWAHEDPIWFLYLEIVAPVPEDVEEPRVELVRVPFEVDDWRSLCGKTHQVPDPASEDDHDQNFYSGPHFENLWDVTLELGAIRGKSVPIVIRGTVYPTKEPLEADARCEIIERRKRPPTADPPVGRKVCHHCKAVSFDEVQNCPSCQKTGWWNEP